jgi:hypothetical protein
MKKLLNLKLCHTLVVLVAPLSVMVCVARAAERPVFAYPADQRGPGQGPFVGKGTSKEDVRLILGAPDVQLAPDIWIYRHRQTTDARINSLGYDTMVIFFATNLVTEQRLVSSAAVAELQSRLRRAAR